MVPKVRWSSFFILVVAALTGAWGDSSFHSSSAGPSIPTAQVKAANEVLDIVEWSPSVSVTEGAPDFEKAVRQKAILVDIFPQPRWSHVDCAVIQEIEDTLLCVFNSPIFMNMALNRAATFVESSLGFLNDKDHLDGPNGGIQSQAEGHDLKGEDMRRFWEVYQSSRDAQPPLENTTYDTNFLKVEEEFWRRLIIPRLNIDPDMVLIATDSRDDAAAIISHEVVHAQFFRSQVFQNIVTDFWQNTVTEVDRQWVRDQLKAFYDVSNEYLVMNEFQAYMLMNRAERRLLKDLLPRYRDKLWSALSAAEIIPIQANIFSKQRLPVKESLPVSHGTQSARDLFLQK